MDNMWTSTWEDDLLFLGTFLFMIVGFVLMCYAFGVTIMAILGNYSVAAVVFYWCIVLVSLCFWWENEPFIGFMFYVWMSPVVAPIMYTIEKYRKEQLVQSRNE